MGFIARILVTAALLFVLGRMVDGIVVEDGKAALIGALLAAALVDNFDVKGFGAVELLFN